MYLNEALHSRLEKVMRYVAGHTRDQWAKDYLLSRLEDLGLGEDKWYVLCDDGHYRERVEGEE